MLSSCATTEDNDINNNDVDINSNAQETDNFSEDYSKLCTDLSQLNNCCQQFTSIIQTVWNNIGPEDLGTCLNCISQFNQDQTLDTYNSQVGKNMFVQLWLAAKGLCPSALNNKQTDFVSGGEAKTIKLCVEYNAYGDEILSLMDSTEQQLKQLRDKYNNKYNTEIDVITEWYMESISFAEFALEPTGSLYSYGTTRTEYRTSLAKYQKQAELYKD